MSATRCQQQDSRVHIKIKLIKVKEYSQILPG